jgi:hypothetical protein
MQILERGSQFACSCLNAIEQANVFDCDHRLVSECLNQLDLFVGEWAHRFALEKDDADGRPLSTADAQHRNERADRCRLRHLVLRIG